MNHCDDIIDDFHRLARDQVGLALVAEALPVAAMHIDLALFGAKQAQFAEERCDEDVAWL